MDDFFLWFIFLFSFISKCWETLSWLGWGGRFLQGINIILWMLHSIKKKLYSSAVEAIWYVCKLALFLVILHSLMTYTFIQLLIRLAIRKITKRILWYFCMNFVAFWMLSCLTNIHVLIYLGKLDDIIGKIIITKSKLGNIIQREGWNDWCSTTPLIR